MTTHAPATPQTKPCPFCAEAIRFEAVKCRFCGSDLAQPQPGTVRSRLLASSPLIALVSLVIGVVGGTAELVGGVANSPVADFLIQRHEPEAEPYHFGPPSELEQDDVRAGTLVAAILIGLVGSVAALLARRRPGTSALLFLGAGACGLAISWIVAVNLVLLALSLLLIAAAIVIAAPRIPFAREKLRIARE